MIILENLPVQCVHNRLFWFCDMRIELECCMTVCWFCRENWFNRGQSLILTHALALFSIITISGWVSGEKALGPERKHWIILRAENLPVAIYIIHTGHRAQDYSAPLKSSVNYLSVVAAGSDNTTQHSEGSQSWTVTNPTETPLGAIPIFIL